MKQGTKRYVKGPNNRCYFLIKLENGQISLESMLQDNSSELENELH